MFQFLTLRPVPRFSNFIHVVEFEFEILINFLYLKTL